MTIVSSHGRPGKTQVISYTATPATSAAIGAHTNRVRLVATTAALVTLGDATSMYLAPNFPEVFVTTGGQSLTVAQVSAAGNLYVTELE
jgi:hypothetical protein